MLRAANGGGIPAYAGMTVMGGMTTRAGRAMGRRADGRARGAYPSPRAAAAKRLHVGHQTRLAQ